MWVFNELNWFGLKSEPVFYWIIIIYGYRNETTKKELDFIIQKEGIVIPIEIRSGNIKARSLNSIIDKKSDIPLGYKFVDGNVGLENKVLTLPLYMLMYM